MEKMKIKASLHLNALKYLKSTKKEKFSPHALIFCKVINSNTKIKVKSFLIIHIYLYKINFNEDWD